LESTGSADPEALADDISVALLTTMWGLVLSFFAIVFLVISVVRYYRVGRMEDDG
jgi:biopolymer transport protein ExbB/TolQ